MVCRKAGQAVPHRVWPDVHDLVLAFQQLEQAHQRFDIDVVHGGGLIPLFGIFVVHDDDWLVSGQHGGVEKLPIGRRYPFLHWSQPLSEWQLQERKLSGI